MQRADGDDVRFLQKTERWSKFDIGRRLIKDNV